MRFLSIIALGAAILAGCATPARVDQMSVQTSVISSQQYDVALRNSIAVLDVTGGKETNPMWTSEVSSADFSAALESSLQSAGLLSLGKQAGNFALTTHLQKLDQPIFGIDMTVTATANYSLSDRKTGKELFAKTISTPFTATFSDAAYGPSRLKIANEGAVKKNIQKLLDELRGFRTTNAGDTKISDESVDEQLKTLKGLFDKGLISREIYEQRQKVVLDGRS